MTRRARPSLAGLAAAALSGAVAVLYLVLIALGDVGASGDGRRVALVATILVALPLCAGVGARRPATNAEVGLLAVAAVGLLIMGFLALFSIGMPLLVASALAWIALFRVARGVGRSGADRLVQS